MSYTANGNRASNVPVTIYHAGGTDLVTVNQKKAPKIDNVWTSLGTFELNGKSVVEIANINADGHVIADAIQALPAK
jgi:hypothetical protein